MMLQVTCSIFRFEKLQVETVLFIRLCSDRLLRRLLKGLNVFHL